MPEITPLKIVLWGPTGAGKSALLSALYHDTHGSSLLVHFTEDSRDFVRISGEDQTNDRFPPATPVGHLSKAFFTIERNGRTAELQIEDRAGGHWTALEEKERTDLVGAAGLVVLIDLQPDSPRLAQELSFMLGEVRVAMKRKDDRPVAVCLSKADAMIRSADDLRLVRENQAEFVRRELRRREQENLEDRIKGSCQRFQLFAISSVGVRLRYGAVEPVVFWDETLRLRKGRGTVPINLASPFEWIMDELCGTT